MGRRQLRSGDLQLVADESEITLRQRKLVRSHRRLTQLRLELGDPGFVVLRRRIEPADIQIGVGSGRFERGLGLGGAGQQCRTVFLQPAGLRAAVPSSLRSFSISARCRASSSIATSRDRAASLTSLAAFRAASRAATSSACTSSSSSR